MNKPLSITKEFSLYIEQAANGSFLLSANGAPIQEWVEALYLNHRESFFGLNAQIEDNVLVASPVEVMEIFSSEGHPFITFSPANEAAEDW